VPSSLASPPRRRQRAAALAALASLAALLAAIAGCSNRAGDQTGAATRADLSVTENTAADSGGQPSGYEPTVVPIGAAEILERVKRANGVTLVNVWATWCAPCRAEMPALLRVARAHRADGMRLMLVSTDYDDEILAVRRFLANHAVAETTFIKTGADNEFINTLHRDWSGALPATLVFDRNGNLTDFWEGAADENRFEHAVIAALIGKPQTEAPK
jgi:thiol-disulfide isomerase/thioredoxin